MKEDNMLKLFRINYTESKVFEEYVQSNSAKEAVQTFMNTFAEGSLTPIETSIEDFTCIDVEEERT